MPRTFLTLISVLVALAGGCADGNPGLLILNVVAPDDTCAYGTSNAQISGGTYDLAVPVPYIAVFRYGNQLRNLSQSGASGPPMADPNIISVQELDIEIRDVAGNAIALADLPNPFRVPAGGGVVSSSDGMSIGEGIGSAEIVPNLYREALAGAAGSSIVVSVKAVGTTAGAAEVVSPEFNFPIALCADCLLVCEVVDEEPVCEPSCTPGQDTIHSACAGTGCR